MKRSVVWVGCWLRRSGLWLLIGIAIAFAWRMYQESGPSVIVDSIVMADDVVDAGVSGDTISFVVKIERRKTCDQVIGRFVWHNVPWQGEQIPDFHPMDNPPLSPMPGTGEHKYMLTLHVPGGLRVGDQWYQRTVSLPQCRLFDWFQSPSNVPHYSDRPITVEAAR